ncbi:hypothetical protein M2244_003067 [Rhodoferax antarcticus]|nr:hypothetical protein [Rhodoferax antarcticus]
MRRSRIDLFAEVSSPLFLVSFQPALGGQFEVGGNNSCCAFERNPISKRRSNKEALARGVHCSTKISNEINGLRVMRNPFFFVV